MKTLIFALAAALPLFASADTNAVSRAEFEGLKKEVEAIREAVSILGAFTRVVPITHDRFFETLNAEDDRFRNAIARMNHISVGNKLRSAKSRKERELILKANCTGEVVTREDLDAIGRELAKVRAENLERESKSDSSTIAATNAPTLLSK